MDHHKNTWRSSSDINKISHEFEVDDDDLHSDYSDIMRPVSPETHVPDPLEIIDKFVSVILKPVNPLTRMQIDRTKSLDKGYYISTPKGNGICIDPFLPNKFPSPAISITPPYFKQYGGISKPGVCSSSLDQSTKLNFMNIV